MSVTVGNDPRGPESPARRPRAGLGTPQPLGPDFLDNVTYVFLQGDQCDDESLRAACRLPWLEELSVVNTGVTDASAEDIRYLTNLRSLDLRLNRITSRTLRHIGGLSDLRTLTLSLKGSPIAASDEDLAFLKRLTKLERLNLFAPTSMMLGWPTLRGWQV